MKIGFSQGAQELLTKSGADASKISQKTLEKLDQDHDGSIAETELRALDFNQDQRISPFEIRDFELNGRELVFPSQASGKPTSSTGLQKPEALPDVSYEGPPIIEVNNPEKISQPGLVFDSASQQPPVNLGVELRDFNYYSYANLDTANPAFQDKEVYQAIVLTNPGDEDVYLDIEGSGYANSKNLTPPAGLDPDEEKAMDNRTRKADFQLEEDMLKNHYQLHGKGVKIPKGGSIVVYTRIDTAKPKTESDLRAGFRFRVTQPSADKMPQGLQMRVAVTTASPGTPKQTGSGGSCGYVEAPVADLLSRPELNKYVPAEGHLRPGTDFTSPQGVRDAVSHWKAQVEAAGTDLAKGQRTPLLSPKDLDNLSAMLTDIEALASKPGVQMTELMPALEKWNLELKMTKRVLENKLDLLQAANQKASSAGLKSQIEREAARIKPEIDLLNGISVSLGRVNGIKEHSEIHSTISMNLPDDGLERVFALVTNPLNTAGAPEAQMVDMQSVTQYPTGKPGQTRPANYQSQSVGNYGVRYAITLKLNNTGDRPLDLRTLFGSPGEHGNQVPIDQAYQQAGGYMKNGQTRFTGQIKITPDQGEPFYVNVVHGKIESPEQLSLLTLNGHTQRQLKIEFVVPTNNTGPHLLHVEAEPKAD